MYISLNKSLPYDVLAINIKSDLNIGNMIRTAHLCGCHKFIIFGRKKYDKRSLVGVDKYQIIEKICGNNLTDRLDYNDYFIDAKLFYNYIIQNNYYPIFIEQHHDSLVLNNENLEQIISIIKMANKMPLFIFGNESIGISNDLIDIFEDKFILELNQLGVLQSFNVSNSLAIVCYKLMEFLSK